MAITRSTLSDGAGTRYKFVVEGTKYSGTASGGGSTWLESTAMTGSVEENVISTGDGARNTYNPGTNSRTRLYDAAGTFLTDGVMPSNVVTGTTTAVYDTDIRGAWFEYAIWLNSTAFPTGNTNYEIHGFAKTTPTAWATSYQWNLLWIWDGTGIGQVRLIKSVIDDGTTVKLIVKTPFTVTPDNTSKFYIMYSPLDIHHESVVQGWGETQALFCSRGQIPVAVDISAEIGVGASTATPFGYAYMYLYGSGSGGQWGWGTYSGWYLDANATGFWGEGDYDAEIPLAKGYKALIGGYSGSPWASPISGSFSKDDSISSYNSNSRYMGSGRMPTNIDALSYDTVNWFGFPYSSTYKRSLGFYGAGLWSTAVPCNAVSVIDGVTTNTIVVDQLRQPQYNIGVTNRGLNYLSNNDGGVNAYYVEHRNINREIVGNFQDEAGNDVDYFTIYRNGTRTYNWIDKKTITYTFLDDISGLPVSGVTAKVTNRRGDDVGESDSGGVITVDHNATTTTITMDDTSGLLDGDLIRIDNEYITVGTVASGTSLTGCTRESRYPNKLRKKFHKSATVNFDPKVYKVGVLLTSDANGQIELMVMAHSVQADYVSGVYADQVTSGGINYICANDHFSVTTTNEPPNASFWTVGGSEGFPWTADRYYHDAVQAFANKGYEKYGPFTVALVKAGYATAPDIFAPTIDTANAVKELRLKRPNLSLAKGVNLEN